VIIIRSLINRNNITRMKKATIKVLISLK